jgi:hypothetical protein
MEPEYSVNCMGDDIEVCVRCTKLIRGRDRSTQLFTTYGPMHRDCGRKLPHLVRYGGEKMPNSVREYGLLND